MTNWLLLLLPVAVVIDATAQGKLNLITRAWVPVEAQGEVNVPLHFLYPWLYVLLAVATYVATLNQWVLLVALLARVALFDPVLNYVKEDKMFAVGTSATTDKAIQFVARKLKVEPDRVSAVLRGLALVVAAYIILRK